MNMNYREFIINCTLCGKCGTKCPQDIDFGEICLEARQQLQIRNELPPVYHEYWINETQFSSEEKASLIRAAQDPDWVFFPGCQLGSSDPEYVTRTYGMLLERLGTSGGIFLRCCGIPFHWAGKEEQFREYIEDIRREYAALGSPVVILTCPSCRKVFEQYLPEIRTEMLWNAITDHSFIQITEHDGTYALFDPCISVGSPEMRSDILAFLDTSEIQYEDGSPGHDSGGCCGYGGLIYLRNEDIYRETASAAVSWSENDILTYCINCRDSFAAQSRRAVHLLDLLLFSEDRAGRKPPTPTERHKNRVTTRNELLRRFWPEESENNDIEIPPEDSDGPEIRFSESAKTEAARLLIFEDDISSLVREAAADNRMIRTGDSMFSCYGRTGSLTCHADFRIEDGIITITDVYAHRISYIGPDISETGAEHFGLMCCRCSNSLKDTAANFEYLGHRIRHTVPVCPVCGQMYVNKELCRSRINEVEMLLEEK